MDKSIRDLFGWRQVGYNLLGNTVHKRFLNFLGYTSSDKLPTDIPIEERISILRRHLENQIILYAEQIDASDDVGAEAIRNKVRSTLMVLRDINGFLPEIETASIEETEAFFKKYNPPSM